MRVSRRGSRLSRFLHLAKIGGRGLESGPALYPGLPDKNSLADNQRNFIPETHRRGFQNQATGGLTAGLLIMLFLDVTLG